MITPEIAVLGVDDDCGDCAWRGLERLAAAVPDIDWPKMLHDTCHVELDVFDDVLHHPYWCDYCVEVSG